MREQALRLVQGEADVVWAEEIEDVVGDEAVEGGALEGELERAVAEMQGDTATVAVGPAPGELVHAGADVGADVAALGGEVLLEHALGEGARAVTELEDRSCVLEVGVGEQRAGCPVLVERLEVLEAADAIVDTSRLLCGEVASARRKVLGGRAERHHRQPIGGGRERVGTAAEPEERAERSRRARMLELVRAQNLDALVEVEEALLRDEALACQPDLGRRGFAQVPQPARLLAPG